MKTCLNIRFIRIYLYYINSPLRNTDITEISSEIERIEKVLITIRDCVIINGHLSTVTNYYIKYITILIN